MSDVLIGEVAVNLDAEANLAGFPDAVGLAAYRIAQESLTSVPMPGIAIGSAKDVGHQQSDVCLW